MNIFSFNIYDYDGNTSYLFYHPTKTHKEFEEDCATLIRKYSPNILAENKGYYFTSDELGYICSSRLEELGYVEVTKLSVDVSDSYAIGTEIEEEEEFVNLLGRDLYEKVKKHNLKISDGH